MEFGHQPGFTHHRNVASTILAHHQFCINSLDDGDGAHSTVGLQLVDMCGLRSEVTTVLVTAHLASNIFFTLRAGFIQIHLVNTHNMSNHPTSRLIDRRGSNGGAGGRCASQFLKLRSVVHIHRKLEDAKGTLANEKARKFPEGALLKGASHFDPVIGEEKHFYAAAFVTHLHAMKFLVFASTFVFAHGRSCDLNLNTSHKKLRCLLRTVIHGGLEAGQQHGCICTTTNNC